MRVPGSPGTPTLLASLLEALQDESGDVYPLSCPKTIATLYILQTMSGTATEDLVALRAKLPPDLPAWRGADVAVWDLLTDFFRSRGYELWEIPIPGILRQSAPGPVLTAGYGKHLYHDMDTWYSLFSLSCGTSALRAARSTEFLAQDVVIRVVQAGAEEITHISILTLVASEPRVSISTNHTLPVLELIGLGDIVFGIFPKAGPDLMMVLTRSRRNSVGDIVNIIMQCLEALHFLHTNLIAHRDAFKENFLIQYHPQSLVTEPIRVDQPRVYLHDFELACSFPEGTPPEEQMCVGPLYGGTISKSAPADHRCSPEVLTGEPYSPYKLDVWQLGTSFSEFKSTIPSIDAAVERLREPDPSKRPTAYEALKELADIVSSMAPRDLVIPPDYSFLDPVWRPTPPPDDVTQQIAVLHV
ncbi:kinase-like domain-containing protein [Epithele typhae]|uniref:kinase-like domain-containing protein n=1 Tax=Epithele typhae TaxID=378194 RepID=UPI0020086EAE|nr:kinase-like domain-containing protein [Epithele typhae]KAH9913568.1 kinase-like domain-containing protein [Epithele typhae]